MVQNSLCLTEYLVDISIKSDSPDGSEDNAENRENRQQFYEAENDMTMESAFTRAVSCGVDQMSGIEHPDAKPHHYRSSLVNLLCGVYVLVLLVLGFAIPLSSEISHGHQDYYVDVFYLYIYLTSIVFLVFIHICLKREPPVLWKPKKPFGAFSFASLMTPSIACGSMGGRLGGERLSIDENTRYDVTKAFEDGPLNFLGIGGEYTDNKTPFINDKSKGVNFYLRLGAMGFATGSMIHDGFKVAQIFEIDDSAHACYGILYMVTAIAHLLFTFIQTYFIFKNHRLVINKYKAIMRLGLSHLVATNINVWSGTLISEIAEDIKEKLEIFELGHTDHGSALAHSNFTNKAVLWSHSCEEESNSLARHAARFLFPCTIEYSLISAAVVYKIYRSIGDFSQDAYPVLQPDRQTSCEKAHRGLFLGLFVSILTLISISLFYVYQAKDTNVAVFIFYASEIVLLFMGIFAVFMGFVRMRHLHFAGDRAFVDTALLLISVFGVLVFNSFAIVSTTSRIKLHPQVCSVALATSLLAFCESIFQTIFILDSLGRCPRIHDHVTQKPGRAVITFLLMCNFCLWLINTFEMERTDTFPIHTEHYGALSWSIITHFCLPMLIFFRFHSTICLSDIWIGAYQLRKKHK